MPMSSNNTLFFSSVIASALICSTFLIYSYNKNYSKREKNIVRVLILYFGVNIIFGFFFILRDVGLIQPRGKAYPFIITYLAVVKVLFFHFIYLITNRDQKTVIPVFHYILPSALFAVTFFFFYLLYHKINQINELNQYMKPYCLVYFLIYQVFYSYLSMKYILLYKKEIGENSISADIKSKYTSWLMSTMVIKFCFIVLIIALLFLGSETHYLLLSIFSILIFFQYIIIIFNVLERNYYFLNYRKNNMALTRSGHIYPESGLANNELKVQEKIVIHQQDFEDYFHNHKPYLISTLKIEDLAITFNTNRQYLSKFISEVYKVNFNQYINSWRINEVNQLTSLKDNQDRSIEELSQMAGFGSVRSYWRAKKHIS